MESEWDYIRKYRDEIVTYIVGCLMFAIIYKSCIDRTAFLFDEVWHGDYDAIFLVTGRWVGYLFRAFLGHGPSYPIAGVMSGLLLNIAILIQLKLYGVKRLWQMLAYSTLYVSYLGWAENMCFTTMCDFFGASVALASLAAYLMNKGGRKNLFAATAALTLAFGCYQSSAITFLALGLLLLMHTMLAGQQPDMIAVMRKMVLVGTAALVAYGVCNACACMYAPTEILEIGKKYQQSYIGWQYLAGCGTALSACRIVLKTALMQPIYCMLGISGTLGQWLYATVWFPAILLVWRTFGACGWRRALLMALACIVLIYVPFLFAPVVLHPRAVSPYMCMAQPIVLCAMWTFGVLQDRERCYRYRKLLLVFLLGVFVKNAYDANIRARDESYFYELSRQEMRNMYLLAQSEEKNEMLQNASFLVCGLRVLPSTQQDMCGDLYPDTALPYYMNRDFLIDSYAAYFRLPKMRAATKDEKELHQQTLSQMPVWPAPGSVKADGPDVLIKISD